MPEIHTIYLVHHSHTDIGYTHDQPIVWEIQNRALLQAIDLAEKYADSDSDGAFRWTVETTAVLQHWLKRASQRDIDRLITLERAGRIEITAMFVNTTPLFDIDQLIESFQILPRLRRDYGFTIESAMNCDVNGQSHALVDVLLDAGINGFSMAINPHSGGAMKPRPHPFLWRGASGRVLPTLNGWTYDKGWVLGIGRDAEDMEQKQWQRAQDYLNKIKYPLPILMIQAFHPFGDNATAFDYTMFIEAWNARGKVPRIVMATPRLWWDAVEYYTGQLPTIYGDWTDYWSFGTISSPREEAISRASRVRLRTADALMAVNRRLPDDNTEHAWDEDSYHFRDEAWTALNLWAEHSWGADDSVWFPDSEDTVSQWYHKAHYAYQARSLSLMMQRDALAALARHIPRQRGDDMLIFNPLPWERTISGAVRPAIAQPRGLLTDTTSSRHHLDRVKKHRWHPEDLDTLTPDIPRLLISSVRVPPFGYAVVKHQDIKIESAVLSSSESDTVENKRFRLKFDTERGGITSLYDKQNDREWVDGDSGYALHTIVHEQVANKEAPIPRKLIYDHPWPTEEVEIPSGWTRNWQAQRTRPESVILHTIYQTPLGWSIVQQLRMPGFKEPFYQRVFLPLNYEYIECESSWHSGLSVHPQAMYVLFPFRVSKATLRFDLGGQVITAGHEQLPGVCRDYFAAQGWMDFSNDHMGITVTLPENPLFQAGDFHFGAYQSTFLLERAMLLGWVSNNYWETNFRAHHPGLVHARYRIYPHAGGFNESRAHRWGLETLHSEPVLQHLGEQPASTLALPEVGTLLNLPELPVYVLHVKPARTGKGMIVRLLNASDKPCTTRIASGLLKLTAAYHCSLFEEIEDELPVTEGSVSVEIPARRIVILQLDTIL